jgi:hypothetical protein
MNRHHAVVHLATVAVPLPRGPHRMLPALGRARFIHATDGLRMSVLSTHDPLDAVSRLLFIPFDRFEKPLQRPRCGPRLQGDRLRRLAVQIGQLTLHIDSQQPSCIASAKTVGEQRQKRTELPSQPGNLL